MKEQEKREETVERLQRMARSFRHNQFFDVEAINDAIALLKTQEPHLLTKYDFIDNPKRDKNGNLPVWIEYRTGMCGWRVTSAETMYTGMYAWGRQKYRYWTAKPSDEQRKAVKWE